MSPAWEGTTAFPRGGKWRRSRKLLIGSVTGIAMAASEDADPFPSVEVPEGADILAKREV